MDLYESQIKMIVRFPTGIREIFTNLRNVLWNLPVKPVNNLGMCRYISCCMLVLLQVNNFSLGFQFACLNFARILIRGSKPLAVGNLGTRLADCKRKSVLLSFFFFSDIFHSHQSIPWTRGKFFTSKQNCKGKDFERVEVQRKLTRTTVYS